MPGGALSRLRLAQQVGQRVRRALQIVNAPLDGLGMRVIPPTSTT
jgi:hypothetical protein